MSPAPYSAPYSDWLLKKRPAPYSECVNATDILANDSSATPSEWWTICAILIDVSRCVHPSKSNRLYSPNLS
jgi:hypothetical protein